MNETHEHCVIVLEPEEVAALRSELDSAMDEAAEWNDGRFAVLDRIAERLGEGPTDLPPSRPTPASRVLKYAGPKTMYAFELDASELGQWQRILVLASEATGATDDDRAWIRDSLRELKRAQRVSRPKPEPKPAADAWLTPQR